MNMSDRFNYYCHLFWLLLFAVNSTILDEIVNTKSEPVFFRWSAGFGPNFQAIRCATDQFSEDPFKRLVDVYPEMQNAVYFPAATNHSQRYNCRSNSSIFVFNPQTRRVHHMGNRHCIVVNENSYHYLATRDYPTVNALRSIDCGRATTGVSLSYLIRGSEFRLIREKNNHQKAALRFISPADNHEYVIYIRGDILVAVDKDDEARKVLDQLREPVLEIIENVTHQ